MRTINLAILAAAVSVAASFAAHAAGLGRLTVFSALGAPLNAEIEIVSLQPGEQDSLTARIASIEAFRAAGIDPSAALSTVRFAIVRREGKPVVRVTSLQPVNEPFLDLLVELEWSGGRLVREYTFLLDPPQYKGPQPIAAEPAVPASAPALAQAPATPAAPAAPAPSAEPSPSPSPSPSAAAQPSIESKPLPMEAPAAGQTHVVRRGETLGEIARAHLPSGVTMNQMLVALYRANQEAFIRENINLVRAGRVLTLPSAEEASGVEVAEANRLVQSHRAEWDDYRTRLAAVPAPAESAAGSRAVAGKIEPKPEAPPAAPQDQVRLSKADPKAGGGGRAARADDLAARERELKEAQSRVADLEKNVADLQKLLEVRQQQVNELEKKAAAATPVATAPKPAPAEAPKPAPAAEAPKPAAVAEAPKPAPAVPAAPVEAKKAAPAVEAKKAEAPKPKPKAATPPAPAVPSLFDEFLDNTAAMGGLALVVLLLVGYGLWSWRRKKAAHAKFSDSVMGPADTSSPAPKEPAFAAAGSSSQVSVSQASGMEAEEVDPIAEADVYMAYGRDAQAEEILKEALQKDPNRIPVHAKLLEIYSKRGDTQAFETSALKIKNLTGGSGAEWDKAVALGRSVDPGNGLYGGGSSGVPSAGPAAAAAMAAAAIGAAAAAPASIDFDIGGGTSSGMVTTDIPLGDAPKPATPSTIDFDLSGSSAKVKPGAFAGSDALNLDNPDPDATLANIKFDLNPGGGAPEPKLGEASGLDFDLNLEGDDKAQTDSTTPPMDLSSISLDLGSAAEAGGAASSNDPKWQEVATKLDLAKAYEEMGDKDGARELLGEVMKDGDAAQKGQAQQILTKLG